MFDRQGEITAPCGEPSVDAKSVTDIECGEGGARLYCAKEVASVPMAAAIAWGSQSSTVISFVLRAWRAHAVPV
jgi:hypothetical protein